jgi:ESS family glutamate:Na+ symporter
MPPSSAVAIVNLNAVQVLALACVGIIAGVQIKRLIPVLDRLNVPASVVGGLIYAAVALLLRDRYMNFEMDLVLRDMFMVAFFTTIGMSASLRLLKVGGIQVALFFGLATAGVVMQNLVGVALAKLLGLHLLLGIIAGSVTMAGGPATALAFGGDFEKTYGVAGALTFGLAAAMFGIVAGGLLAGFVGGSFIERLRLHARSGQGRMSAAETAEAAVYPAAEPDEPTQLRDESESESGPLMHTVVAIAVAMGVGTLISAGFERTGVRLPAYVGAMFAAGILRNVDDATRWFGISQRQMDTVGSIALNIFIVMALLTLRLWEIVNLAAPMMVIVAAQILLVWLMASVVFRLMGRDYDAAVMSGGFTGFMLGTSANAMACLEVLSAKYGPAPRAFLVVPIVGAFLIDFTNAMVITAFANWFR